MRATGPVEITERDVKIMQFAFEQRALNFTQIHQRFFPSTKQSTVHYRLGRLVRDGYLSKYGVTEDGPLEIIYGLKPKGLDVARKGYRFEITAPYYKSDSPLHDIALTDVRTRLEKTTMLVDYRSENMLQACRELAESTEFQPFALVNSDAALVLQGPQKTFQLALEFEASEKIAARYGKKLLQYYLSPDIVAVFYVCRGARIERLIRKVDADFDSNSESKIYTCLEETLHSGALPVPFTNRKGTTFLFK